MSRLVLPSELLKILRTSLFKDENESCAVLLARAVTNKGKLTRIVAREIIEPFPDMYDFRTPVKVQLKPEFVAMVTQRARKSGDSLVFVHTHPFSLNKFSRVDDEGEIELANFLKKRTPGVIHASLLLTPETSVSRILGENNYLRVLGIGTELIYNSENDEDKTDFKNKIDFRYDRQIRAFGREGQTKLESFKIGIVGLGGTGSVIAQQLAHLGVKKYLLIDPDTLEESNLNRVVGATRGDLKKSKVIIAAENIRKINQKTEIETIEDSILKNSIAELLTDTDFVFACTDSHGSRAILNQLAYQYFLPVIDMGVVISVKDGKVENMAGRTQLLAPGLPCMVCGNLLDYEEVRRDLLTDFERKNDPYILNDHEPAPAVISLNSTISSMAITMFLSCVVGIPGTARLINYNAISGVSRPAVYTRHPTCVVCSKSGSLGKANVWPLPGRLDY